ncbi:hypothetical protein BV20DRAFT_960762 [Pilatotrama ljubarskyi]|nr:hypothetical protein BV20DRAFT_960762 [Pilatotrama ljubarskyi]
MRLPVMQLVVTIVLTTYGIKTRATEPGRSEGRSEFRACLDLSLMNLAWLVRTVFVVYLLVWGYRIREVGRRQYVVETSRSANPFSDTVSQSEDDPTLSPGEELYDVIPADSRRRYNLLTGLIEPLITIYLFLAMQLLYIFRRRRCGEVAPHIAQLTSTLLLLFCITLARSITVLSQNMEKRRQRRGRLYLSDGDRS